MSRRHAGLAERVAADLRAAFPELCSLPVDLDRLADLLGVTAVREEEISEEGRVRWLADGPRVELRADRPPMRRRFTLAHELAHVLLSGDQPVGRVARRSLSADPSVEEELCDALAAAILMPQPWIKNVVGQRGISLPRLRAISRAVEVSLAAAAVRVAEVGRCTSILLRWRRVPSGWVCASAAAVPPALFGRIRMSERTADAIDELHGTDTWVEVSLTFDGTPMDCTAHVSRSDRGCLMLVTDLRVPTNV